MTEENVPAAHAWHAAEPEAYIPEGQLVAVYKQEEAPVGEYVPAPQGVQETAPLLEYVPAAQRTQVEEAVAPKAEENVPEGQKVQEDAPTEEEYVPAPQRVQETAP
jgi:hypothetical protein